VTRGNSWWWLGIALFQLVLVFCGAASIDVSRLGSLGTILNYYGEVSGSGSGYGFFSPGVESQIGAEFDIVGSNGQVKTTTIRNGLNQEADLRLGNIIDQFGTEQDDPKAFQRSLSASLAGYMFGKNPDAREVVVRLQEYYPPSMADYRAGKRAKWAPVYSATFKRRRDAE
jgi:hypothetical protein